MRRVLAILLSLLLATVPCHAAIALDVASTATPAGASSSLTWSHTTTGSDRILVVCFRVSGDSSGLTGITYNVIAMTLLASAVVPDGSLLYAYYLIAPATGAHNIVASYGATAFSAVGVATSYTGAKQSGQPDSSNTGTAATTGSITVATTVVAANSWQILCTQNTNYTNSTIAGTGSTIRAGGSTSAAEDLTIFDSNGTVSTGSQSMQASVAAGSPNWGGISASIAPVGGAAASAPKGLLLGVGP